ncbi:MAG: hypothetical protein FJ088_07700 [Deltaproteobacteria bacterium]|nr:hypothetical protein [Deltaproteobacteria bacterium]
MIATPRAKRALAAAVFIFIIAEGIPLLQDGIAHAENDSPAITHDIEGKEIVVGEPFTFKFIIEYPEGHKFYFPDSPDFGQFKMLSHDSTLPAKKGDLLREEHAFALIPVRLGNGKIPEISVPYISKEGKPSYIPTPKVMIQVKGKIGDELNPQLKMPRAPFAYPVKNKLLIWALTIATSLLVGGALACLAYIYIGRRRRANLPPPPPRPAHIVAFEKIERLKEMRLIEKGKIREFFFHLSEIVREYFGNLLSFESLDMTTTELLAALEGRDLRELTKEEISDFMSTCDLVKFAKFTPHTDAANQMVERSVEIVRRSMSVEADKGVQDSSK